MIKTNSNVQLDDLMKLEILVSSLVKRNQISKFTRYKNYSREKIKSKIVPIWLEWLKMGKLGNRPVGIRGLEIYDYYFGLFLKLLPDKAKYPIVSLDNFREVLSLIPVERYSTRRNVYDALMSITKYLVAIDEFDKEERENIKKIKPKRFLPARRPCLTQDQFEEVLKKADVFTYGNKAYDRLLNKTLLLFMANTGLRVSEVAKLSFKDVDLEARIVYVWLGKMNKNRRVGITGECLKALQEYLPSRLEFSDRSSFFVNGIGGHLNKHTIHQKLERLSHGLDFKVTPHMLRRYFVTSNVARGRQLVYLQIACGHADITTTRNYCQTSEDEVLEAMLDW